MKKITKINSRDYFIFLNEVKEFIKEKQLEAFRKVNRTLIELYWNLGEKIISKQKKFNWGNLAIKTLSQDLQKEFPGVQGFSVRNLHNMRNFYLGYCAEKNLQEFIFTISWSHHIAIIDRIKDLIAREYYIRATKKYGWTKNVLIHKIESNDFERFAMSVSNNFEQVLPEHIQNQAKLALKDHFVFDFLEMSDKHTERELENGLINHLQQFLVELGIGEFTFVGRQFKVKVGGREFFIDLLFYHRSLCSLIACELKIGEFQPEYAGKMNFYLAALDNQVRKAHENPSIGIILCKEKNKAVVEYAFANQNSPMGAATYTLKKELPKKYEGLLPSAKILKQQMQEWDHQSNSVSVKNVTERMKNKITSQLNKRQIKLLCKMQIGDKITTREYSKKRKISANTALRDLSKLEKKGYLIRIGRRRGSYFQLEKIF